MVRQFKKLRTTFSFNLVLTIKWALHTSALIFVLFTTFAVITYKTSTNLMISQEKANLKQTLSEITTRLEQIDEELTIRNTTAQLKKNNGNLSVDNSTETIEANLIQLNSFISELSQPDLTVSIFNTDQRRVFETKPMGLSYQGNTRKVTKEETVGDKTGLLVTQGIYSQKSNELTGYVQLFFDLSSVYHVRTKLLSTMLLLISVGVVISLILGFLLSSYFLRPLKQITKTIAVIKSEAQSEVRLPVLKTKDEFSELTDTFNEMMDRMQRFIIQQQQFVEDVSHELRTPVAIIEGHLKLLTRWGKDDPEVLEESLEASLQEITRMKSLVQEMLDLSRVEQIEFQHKNDTSQAKEVTHQTFNNFKILYEDFTFILDDDLHQELIVGIYRNHFEQLLIIILDNAVKYSRERKEIHMSVSSSQSELEIAIQDYGEGITEQDLDQVFNRFYRVDKARTRHRGGNGLGLSIAKELVESYGGRIYVESAVGVGSIFRIFLPIKKQELASE